MKLTGPNQPIGDSFELIELGFFVQAIGSFISYIEIKLPMFSKKKKKIKLHIIKIQKKNSQVRQTNNK